MPSFFDFLDRMAKGEPIFKDSSPQSPSDDPSSSQPSLIDESRRGIRKHDPGSFPVVSITRVKTHYNGDKIDLYCSIRNTWPAPVMIDKIILFEKTRELDRDLGAHEEHDFLVYSGPKLAREYPYATLHYKTEAEGDYFEAVHDIRYVYHQNDKSYEVSEMRLRLPIRDIYEP